MVDTRSSEPSGVFDGKSAAPLLPLFGPGSAEKSPNSHFMDSPYVGIHASNRFEVHKPHMRPKIPYEMFRDISGLSFLKVFLILFVCYVLLACVLATCLLIVTKGNVEGCIRTNPDLAEPRNFWGFTEYYFFTVETMFTIGYGSPRSPQCPAAAWFTSVIVITTTLMNGLTAGLMFSKFSEGPNSPRNAFVQFSSFVCVEQVNTFESMSRNSRLESPTVDGTPNLSFEDQSNYRISFQCQFMGTGADDADYGFCKPEISVFWTCIDQSTGETFARKLSSLAFSFPLELPNATPTVVYGNATQRLLSSGTDQALFVILSATDAYSGKPREQRKLYRIPKDARWDCRFFEGRHAKLQSVFSYKLQNNSV